MELCDKNKCVGCTACYESCPKKAIQMIQNEEGFLYPQIDKSKCVECGLCKKACPVINSKEIKKEIHAYAAFNNNLNERLQSSSGGIFSLLAKEILEKKGVVFGACFDKEFNVVHDFVEKIEDLEKLRGSKYVQSQINNSYKMAKDFLEEGRYVLFTGTPCQIEGLNQFLGKEYKNLYTQDLICHGSPSPMIWEKYKQYRNSQTNESPKKISFRYKDDSWRNFKVYFEYKNKRYISEMKRDPYMRAFLKNVCLRESCYNCLFKKIYRNSDITLGDFWGIEKVCNKFNDDKGTSLVVINSHKGKELYESIKKYITNEEVEFNEAIKGNSAYYESVRQHKNRDKFYKHIVKDKNFDKITEKYVKDESKYIRFLKKVFRKIVKVMKKDRKEA